jgi:hypothetical protein
MGWVIGLWVAGAAVIFAVGYALLSAITSP